MLDGRAGSDRLKSMHLVLLVFKSNWRPRKESCMALKLVWRVVNTVSKEGPEEYNGGYGYIKGIPVTRICAGVRSN